MDQNSKGNSFQRFSSFLQKPINLTPQIEPERIVEPVIDLSNEKMRQSLPVVKKIPGTKKAVKEPHNINQDHQGSVWHSDRSVSEVQKKFSTFIDEAIVSEATDISIVPATNGPTTVFFRRFGMIQSGKTLKELPSIMADELVRYLRSLSKSNIDGSRIREPEDGQFTYISDVGEVYIRCSFISTARVISYGDQVSVSLRLFSKRAQKIELSDLSVDPFVIDSVKEALGRSQGMIVLAGPTNSGKSTTCAGIMGLHQDMYGGTLKRLSIEDPVERHLPGVLQIPIPSSLQYHQSKFATILRSVLRHDPNFIYIGEIRDGETANTCIRASSSGHFVVTTIHANSAIMAWKTLLDLADPKMKLNLSESLSLVISQRLVRKLCPNCKIEGKIANHEQTAKFEAYCNFQGFSGIQLPKKISRVKPGGCEQCTDGYSGVYPINELLPITQDVRFLLYEEDNLENYKALMSHRSLTLFDSAFRLFKKGCIDIEDVFV